MWLRTKATKRVQRRLSLKRRAVCFLNQVRRSPSGGINSEPAPIASLIPFLSVRQDLTYLAGLADQVIQQSVVLGFMANSAGYDGRCHTNLISEGDCVLRSQ